jgi:hypothetical protein
VSALRLPLLAATVTLVVALTLVPLAQAAPTSGYPIPRQELKSITTLCVRSIAHVGATIRRVNYSRYQVVCSFHLTGGGTGTISVTRPTFCSLRFRLFINGRLDSQARLPEFC